MIDPHRLRQAADAVPAGEPTAERDLWARGRRRRRLRRAATAGATAIVLTVGTASAMTLLPADQIVVSDLAGQSEGEAETPAVEGTPIEIDERLLRAVAPYDHASMIDMDALLLRLHHLEDVQVAACMRERGVDVEDPVPYPAPHPDDRGLQAYAGDQWPHVEWLLEDGLPYASTLDTGVDAPPHPFEGLSEHDAEVHGLCLNGGEPLDLATRPVDGVTLHPAMKAFGDLTVAWERERARIDADSALEPLRDQFRSCLEDAGVGPVHTADPTHFFGHVNGLVQQLAADPDLTPETFDAAAREVHEQWGRRWASCGRDFFELREQLRAGERRDAFLDQHADQIAELAALLEEADDVADGGER